MWQQSVDSVIFLQLYVNIWKRGETPYHLGTFLLEDQDSMKGAEILSGGNTKRDSGEGQTY